MHHIVKAAALAVFIAGIFATSASATTYEYVGNELSVVLPCCTSAPGLTGSVTFDFNTFDFSGTVDVNGGHVTALQLGGGSKGNYLQFGAYFFFDKGAITNWALQSFGGGWSSFSFGSVADYVEIGGGCSPVCYIAYNSNPGVWTAVDLIAPVPGAVVGTGLPSILTAIAGFIGWRRSRWRSGR